MGIASLEDLNRALLSKWIWRYKTESGALWTQIIDSIHGPLNCIDGANRIKTGHTWRRIVHQWDDLNKLHLDPRNLIKKNVGNGKDTRFWLDWWSGDKTLEDKFPRLFNLESVKNVTVEEKMQTGDGIIGWRNRVCSRDGRSKVEMEQLMKDVESVAFSDKPNFWFCPEGPKEKFNVGWMRKKITDKTQVSIGIFKWSRWIPKRNLILAWRGVLNRLATKDNLIRLGLNMGSQLCDICNKDAETLTHTFKTCGLAKDVWAKAQIWCGFTMHDFLGLDELIANLEEQVKTAMEKGIYYVVAVAVISQLWKNRNDATFMRKTKSAEEVLSKAQEEAFLWIDSRAKNISIDRNQWLFSPISACKTL